MSTAAEAATEAASAPAETTEAIEPAAGTEAPAEGAPESAAKPKGTSELVRLAREKRALERKLEELTRAPAKTEPTVTKESLVADLKKRYEEDPDAFLEEVTGEDFVKMASRLAKRQETAKAPENKIEALEKEIAALKAERQGEKTEKSAADAKALVAHQVKVVQGEVVEAKDEDGAPKYPTLMSLDPEALDEPVAVTIRDAVERAFLKECCGADGKLIKRWPDDVQEARFHAAAKAVDAHYARLRTPKTPKPQNPQEPEPMSPTISNHTSSGTVDAPVRRAEGTLTVRDALRKALREQGINEIV
jgi:hypothetical protein